VSRRALEEEGDMTDKPKMSRRQAIRAIGKEPPQPKKKVIKTGLDLAFAVLEKKGAARALTPVEVELRRNPNHVAAELRRAEAIRAAMDEVNAMREQGRGLN
jgi:Tfp pilus assembly protein PilF